MVEADPADPEHGSVAALISLTGGEAATAALGRARSGASLQSAEAGERQLLQRLLATGSRRTAPRVFVLQTLAGHGGHLSVEQVHAQRAP